MRDDDARGVTGRARTRAGAVGERQARAEAAEALERARRTPDAFLRAQALAHLAWHASAGEWEALARECAAACDDVAEPFQRASILAWPVRIYLDRRHPDRAEALMAEALRRADDIDNPLSRADAINILWDAAAPYPSRARHAAVAALVRACTVAESWKTAGHLRDATLTLAREDVELARRLLPHIPEGQFRRQAEARLHAGPFPEPRWFFDPRGSSVD
jgi:hypothetical protein